MLRVIGIIKNQDTKATSYRLLDLKTLAVTYMTETELKTYLKSHKLSNIIEDKTKHTLISTDCSISRIPSYIVANGVTTRTSKNNVIILKVIKAKGVIVGYQVCLDDKVYSKKTEDVLNLIASQGVSNAKLIKSEKGITISAIKGAFDVDYAKAIIKPTTNSNETETDIQHGKFSVAEMVTKKILDQLAKGDIPWKKPWVGIGSVYNYVSGRSYKGINVFLLDEPGAYLTLKEFYQLRKKYPAAKMKAKVKWEYIVYWNPAPLKWVEVEEESETEKDDTGKPLKVKVKKQIKQPPKLIYHKVAHLSNFEGIPPKKRDKLPNYQHQPEQIAEQVIEAYSNGNQIPIHYVEGTNQAFFRPSTLEVHLPIMSQFKALNEYYATVFHELTHSTGPHLKRDLGHFFGSDPYSKEELVAELGACIILSTLGMQPPLENSAAYIQGWSKKLRDDPNLFPVTAQQAQKAVDFILSFSPDIVPKDLPAENI